VNESKNVNNKPGKKKSNSTNLTAACDLRCPYTDATSPDNKTKLDEFKLLVPNKHNPHLLMITETCFSIKSFNKIDGYSLFTKNREQTTGRGVAIYVRNDLNSSEVMVNVE